ncbi:MAG: hypothetical protein ACI30A_06690 [Paludibacteraceae bacterium]
MEVIIYKWLVFILPIVVSVISSVVTWFAARHTRQVSTIESMQHSIDMLVTKNEELYTEIIEVRAENEALKIGQQRISAENEGLRKQLDNLLAERQELKNLIANLRTSHSKKNKTTK